MAEYKIDIKSELPETIIDIKNDKCFFCNEKNTVKTILKTTFYEFVNYNIIEKIEYICEDCIYYNLIKCIYCDKDYLTNSVLCGFSDSLLKNPVNICKQCFIYEGCTSCGYLSGISPCHYCR